MTKKNSNKDSPPGIRTKHYADLHIHSIYSDGLLSPYKILCTCQDLDLRVISITDHDTVSGVAELIDIAQGKGIEIIPAVEMSSNIGDMDIHILGYYIDYRNQELLSYLEDFKRHRVERVKKIIGNLASNGISLEFEQIKVAAKNCSLGRPHIAEVLLENGYVRSINEAFAKFLHCKSPYYEPKKSIHPREVMKKIRDCNGIPVIAHPAIICNEDIIYQLIMDGALGIEVWHPDHTPRLQSKFYEIALKNNLLMTGGSDCHGRRPNSVQIGLTGCSEDEVKALKKCWQNLYHA